MTSPFVVSPKTWEEWREEHAENMDATYEAYVQRMTR